MKILYSIPSLETVYAARFVYEGFKNAFLDLNHDFRPFTANDNFEKVFEEYKPDIFMYSLNFYHLKFINLNRLNKIRKKNLKVFCQIRAWNRMETKEIAAGGLKENLKEVNLIKNGLAGDVYWHWFEQDEPLMDGFTKETGYKFETIQMAADKTLYFPEYDKRYESDLAYVGSYLPAKRDFFLSHVLPLRKEYDLKIYGSDWTLGNRALGYIQKTGQYFNINILKRVRGLGLSLEEERKVYSSAKISLNVHEEQVKRYNCEINERTFKILACGGFEIVDNVPLLRRFFSGEELVVAENSEDWFKKIDYYLKHPKERHAMSKRAMKKVLSKHTYHNRVNQIIGLYKNII